MSYIKNVFAKVFVSILFATGMQVILSSCGGSTNPVDNSDTVKITVDSLMSNPQDYVGKMVCVSGNAAHFGLYEGMRLFISGAVDSVELRCDVTAVMGDRFPSSCLGKQVELTGMLQEVRVDERYLQLREQQFHNGKVQDLAHHKDVDEITESIAEGESFTLRPEELDSAQSGSAFHAIVDKYRKLIEVEKELTGKDYISTYYLDVVKWRLL